MSPCSWSHTELCYHPGGAGPAADKVGTMPLHSPVAFAHLLLGSLGMPPNFLEPQLAPLTGAELLQELSGVLEGKDTWVPGPVERSATGAVVVLVDLRPAPQEEASASALTVTTDLSWALFPLEKDI